MNLTQKLEILADAAKYDVSCASSGSGRKAVKGKLGSGAACGICHTFTEDGRCVSLFKILFTNFCVYDCAYCVNRRSNDIPRAAFTVRELVELTIDFYRRNYIEGLFLSSGVAGTPDETMEKLVRVVRELRLREGFNGYIHLKGIPGASPRLVREAGRHADRLSINIELPSEGSLTRLTGGKRYADILGPMGLIEAGIRENREDRRKFRHAPSFAPAGQSTQLVIGASPETDWDILKLSDRLYAERDLRRVYYSAFIPVAPDNRLPPLKSPPLVRENRLYQADWLLRLYGFDLREILTPEAPTLDPAVDPKAAFAARNPHLFPVDVNRADFEMLLRVPGLGLFSAQRIVEYRKLGTVRFEHLHRMGVALNRAAPFLDCPGHPARPPMGGYPLVSGEIGQVAEASAANPTLVYDGTFDGLLTVVFRVYSEKIEPAAIESGDRRQLGLFGADRLVETDPERAGRVWKKLAAAAPDGSAGDLFMAFLSGAAGVEMTILMLIRHLLTPGLVGEGAALDARLRVDQLRAKVKKEAHRMRGFARFERMADGTFFAAMAPEYDVLPLIRDHFETRFSDQPWVLYDTRREYGLYFDTRRTQSVQLKGRVPAAEKGGASGDEDVSDLWRTYFQAINIPERRNPRLHLQKLPRKYWGFLTEKRGT
jgi:probable DNA metabolism protein